MRQLLIYFGIILIPVVCSALEPGKKTAKFPAGYVAAPRGLEGDRVKNPKGKTQDSNYLETLTIPDE